MSQTKPSFAGDGQLDLTASLPGGRGYPRLTALPNGDALACGDTIDGFSCERYDAQQESWVIMPMPPMLHNPHMATLSDGTLILVGGTENGEGKAKVWRRDAIDGEFRQLADLPQAIESRTVFVMQDDTVLVYDGSESDFFLLSPAADSFTRFINEAHRSYEPFLESQGLKLRDDRSGDWDADSSRELRSQIESDMGSMHNTLWEHEIEFGIGDRKESRWMVSTSFRHLVLANGAVLLLEKDHEGEGSAKPPSAFIWRSAGMLEEDPCRGIKAFIRQPSIEIPFSVLQQVLPEACRAAYASGRTPELDQLLREVVAKGTVRPTNFDNRHNAWRALCLLAPSWGMEEIRRAARTRGFVDAGRCLAIYAESLPVDAVSEIDRYLEKYGIVENGGRAEVLGSINEALRYSARMRQHIDPLFWRARKRNAANFDDFARVVCRDVKSSGADVQAECHRRSRRAMRRNNIAEGFPALAIGTAILGGSAAAIAFTHKNRNRPSSRGMATFSGSAGGLVVGAGAGMLTGISPGGNHDGGVGGGFAIMSTAVGLLAGGIAGGAFSYGAAKEPGNRRTALTTSGMIAVDLATIAIVIAILRD